MGKKGACEGSVSREQKLKMMARVKKALMEKRKILGSKASKVKYPPGCLEGTYPRPYWLPAGWLHGIKEGTFGLTGLGLRVYISPGPEFKKFYHRPDVETFLGRKLSAADGVPPTVEEMMPTVLRQVGTIKHSARSEAALFSLLSPAERTALPNAKAFHFCVISARRTDTKAGMLGCLRVQAHFEACGVKPRWYVDEKSLARYKRLGFDAVKDGGSLCGARNKALEDAARLGKICCQVSDDIHRWQYCTAKQLTTATGRDDDAANRARKKATILVVSPLAAARFMVAKMRSNSARPKLGGVYPNENIARALFGPDCTTRSFILGDFFVSEPSSRIRFDKKLTLKEDYDFSAAHIQKYGAVLRCNRMWLSVKHRTNAGGACTVRNKLEEQKNIKILKKKWPRAIRNHTVKEDEVILQWPKSGTATEME